MVCFGGSTLFHRKSRSNLRSNNSRQVNMEERALRTHARQFSIASSNDSRASSDSQHSSKAPSFHPLSSHPPMRLNAGPVEEVRFSEDEYSNKENRDTRALEQSEYQPVHSVFEEDDDDDDDDDYSLLGDNDYYTTSRPHDSRRMTYIYDQSAQWPLKDWQTISPGLVAAAAAAQANGDVVYTTPLRPRPANHQRRPTEWMNDPDVFVKRGAWKRRGIVFGLDSDGEQEQTQHFELPN